MSIYYYITFFPTETLIASMLPPKQFGSYMATGSRKGSSEKIIFAEIEGRFGDYFDWSYADERCVPHPNGDPKNSVYLSVYRVIEHMSLAKLKCLYLTTSDGRTLSLESGPYEPGNGGRKFFVFKELCPINPLVVSVLDPLQFGKYMTDPGNKLHVPCIIFADLKIVDLNNPENTGNIGSIYDNKIDHLKDCIHVVTTYKDKFTKTLDRSHMESFSYQAIRFGIFVSTHQETLFFKMKSSEELKADNESYDWGKSAMIL